LPFRTAITIASLCTSMPIYWMSRLISVASFGGKGHSSPTLIFPPKVKCHSPADLPMPSCTSFPPHTPLQLLSSRRSGAEPCTAQRSGGGATSSFDLLKRALFHNALTAVYEMSTRPIIHGEKSATSRLLADADDGLHRRVVKTRNVHITLHTHGRQSAPTRTVRAPMVHHDVRRRARYV